jgi:hypothetical protein
MHEGSQTYPIFVSMSEGLQTSLVSLSTHEGLMSLASVLMPEGSSTGE